MELGQLLAETRMSQALPMWGGRPRPRGSPGPASPGEGRVHSGSEEADEGVGRGPGVRPTKANAATPFGRRSAGGRLVEVARFGAVRSPRVRGVQ